MLRALIPFVLLALSVSAQAKQLVLIQGYLSNSGIWQESGITRLLSQNDWSYSGEYYSSSNGVGIYQAPETAIVSNRYYLVALPTEASLSIQGYYLKAYLKHLRHTFPSEPIILVGHSAGGVLARYVMVQAPELQINQLITIASPHLGTESAELGKLLGDSPLALFTPMIGAGAINRSQGLYRDLLPEQPGRLLYWLNRQPHPDAEYISIVRDKNAHHGGDMVVEENSQYLEQVYDLRLRAYSYVVPATHNLSIADGYLILDLINERKLRTL